MKLLISSALKACFSPRAVKQGPKWKKIKPVQSDLEFTVSVSRVSLVCKIIKAEKANKVPRTSGWLSCADAV